MSTDADILAIQVKSLEKELKAARRTLRDDFAMAALTGLLAHHGDAGWHPEAQVQSIHGALETAFEYADVAMEVRQ